MATHLIGTGAPLYGTLQAYIDAINALGTLTENETGQLLSEVFAESPTAHEFSVAAGGFVLTLEAAAGAAFDPVTFTGALVQPPASVAQDVMTVNTEDCVFRRTGYDRLLTANAGRETIRDNVTGFTCVAVYARNAETNTGAGNGDCFLQGGGLTNFMHSCIAVGNNTSPGFNIALGGSIVENCVAYQCDGGFAGSHGTNINCCAIDCLAGFTASGTIDYGWSTDATISGGNNLPSQDAAMFVDAANDDFRVDELFPGFPGANTLFETGDTPTVLDAMDPLDDHASLFNRGCYNGSFGPGGPAFPVAATLRDEPVPIYQR